MNNDVYVVCGGTRGIGLTVVEQLSKIGNVVMDGTKVETVNKAMKELKEKNVEAVPVICDITKPEQVENLVKVARSKGRLAGIAVVAGVTPVEESWERIFEVDLFGHLSIMKAFMPFMEEGTAMVCISSMAGYLVTPSIVADGVDNILSAADTYEKFSDFIDDIKKFVRADDPSHVNTDAYGVAKRGVHVQVRKQAIAFASRGLRIVSLSPGIIDTQTSLDEFDRDAKTEAKEMHMLIDHLVALKRMGRTYEIASVVEFLLSDKASFITGTDILVDGGCVGTLIANKVSLT
ncbi:SDR family oxidoreductase [Clostridium thailandense]|uniref:SDR family oxidoreductase n=1 Tax=Clostridium thailandense TaxID=2794346 RepID=UPI00398A3F67